MDSRSVFAAFLLGVALAGSSCSSPGSTAPTPPPASPPADARVEIRGRVVDFLSGQGLADVAVTLGDAQARTAQDGLYVVRVLPGSSYSYGPTVNRVKTRSS